MNPVNKILGYDISKNRIGDIGDNPDDKMLVDDSVLTPNSIRPSLNSSLNRKIGYQIKYCNKCKKVTPNSLGVCRQCGWSKK